MLALDPQDGFEGTFLEIDQTLNLLEERKHGVIEKLETISKGYTERRASILSKQLVNVRMQLECLSINEGKRIGLMTSETSATASKMSDALRSLDAEQGRILEAIQMLGRVERIKELIGDTGKLLEALPNKLSEACKAVQDLAHFSETSIKAYEARYSVSISFAETLSNFQDKLTMEVLKLVDEVLGNEGLLAKDQLLKAFNLLEMLDRTKEGVIRYSAFLNKQGEIFLNSLLVKATNQPNELFYPIQLSKMFEYACKSLTWSSQHVLGPSLNLEMKQIVWVSYLQMVEDLIELFLLEFIQRIEPSNLKEDEPLPLMDLKITELGLVIQHISAFLRFLSTNSQDSSVEHLYKCEKFEDILLQLLSIYPTFEAKYMHLGMLKVLEVDQPIDGEPLSSALDDTFFLAKKCSMRAFSIKSHDAIFSICLDIQKELTNNFTNYYGKKLKSPPTAEKLRAYVVTFNNLFAAVGFLQKLAEELMEEFGKFLQNDSGNVLLPSRDLTVIQKRFDDIMAGYSQLKMHLETTGKAGVKVVYNQMVKGKLTSHLAMVFKDIHHVIQVEEEDGSPITRRYISGHAGLFSSFDNFLSDTSRLELISLIAVELIKSWLNQILSSKFNYLGAIQLDKDIRKMMGFLVESSEIEVRELFSPLTFAATLLVAESREEALNIANSIGNILPGHIDANRVIKLRIDW